MSNVRNGVGVQVLFVEADGTYRVDEAALRRVAAHEAARGLPVAVVSVSGATRGGKSFLLDFFLRYLCAPEAARRSGAWIGADDEPLTGFAWRGGCDRDTQGILIWSEPIILTVHSEGRAEEVAVVLMDTQGTFDTRSTMRDSTTIFAISTLLSSVQIYNIFQNIKEDDLQYLQLFTEYSKLARNEELDSPFQVLQLLVRDWSYAYEHPVGAEGGQQLLDKRLEIRSEQAEELREIRQHVRSAFECVRCFLLPHPGLTVASSPHFRGCLADIRSEFKNALVELVPSLFAPENITVKRINGQQITFQDFADYFITYIDIFNSNVLPTPNTVLQATSRANLEAALRTSRDAYCAYMESHVCGGRSVRRDALPRIHGAALDAARAAFASRRNLAAAAHCAARLAALLQELDAMLPHYTAINHNRILVAILESRIAYQEAMLAVASESCLSSAALLALHEAQVAAARGAFDASRGGPPEDDAEDDDWQTLENELTDLLPLHRERNCERISRACEAAREAYTARMRDAMSAAPCLHPASLRSLHSAARNGALAGFLDKWSDDCPEREEHKDALLNYITEKLQEFDTVNVANNEREVNNTLNYYDNLMSDVFDNMGSLCLHPLDLAKEHERAADAAIARFERIRAPLSQPLSLIDYLQGDRYIQKINDELPRRYSQFEEQNETRNEDAVTSAHKYYVRKLDPPPPQNMHWMLQKLQKMATPPDFSMPLRHSRIRNEALEHFQAKRRVGPQHDVDKHLKELNIRIQCSFIKLVTPLIGSVLDVCNKFARS